MPPNDNLTEDQKRELAGIAATAARGNDNRKPSQEDLAAQQRLQKIWINLFDTKEFNQLLTEGEAWVQRQPPRPGGGNACGIFADAVKTIGDLAYFLYGTSKEALKRALQASAAAAKHLGEALSQIMQAVLFSLCMIAAIIVVVSLGIICFIVSVLTAAIEGVWMTIKAVTGFVWSVFVTAIQNPIFWASVAAAGAGVAIANPLVGAIIYAVGFVGTAVTS